MTNHIKQRLDFLIFRRREGSLFFNSRTGRQLVFEFQMEITSPMLFCPLLFAYIIVEAKPFTWSLVLTFY